MEWNFHGHHTFLIGCLQQPCRVRAVRCGCFETLRVLNKIKTGIYFEKKTCDVWLSYIVGAVLCLMPMYSQFKSHFKPTDVSSSKALTGLESLKETNKRRGFVTDDIENLNLNIYLAIKMFDMPNRAGRKYLSRSISFPLLETSVYRRLDDCDCSPIRQSLSKYLWAELLSAASNLSANGL